MWIDTINNSIYPYTKISEEYQLKPEVFYSFQEGDDSESVVINGNEYESYELNASVATEYKIDLSVFKKDSSVDLDMLYNMVHLRAQ